MRDAGERDKLITIQQSTTDTDDFGEEIDTWVPIGREWAAVFYGTGQERRQAAAEQGMQAATFNVLANEMTRAIKLRDRIIFGEAWDIVGISPIGRGAIDFTAVRAN